MEEIQNLEKNVNWIRPNLQNERSEIVRAIKEFIGFNPTLEDIERVTKIHNSFDF